MCSAVWPPPFCLFTSQPKSTRETNTSTMWRWPFCAARWMAVLPFWPSAKLVVYGSSRASMSVKGLSHRMAECSFLVFAAQASFSSSVSSRKTGGAAGAPPPPPPPPPPGWPPAAAPSMPHADPMVPMNELARATPCQAIAVYVAFRSWSGIPLSGRLVALS